MQWHPHACSLHCHVGEHYFKDRLRTEPSAFSNALSFLTASSATFAAMWGIQHEYTDGLQ
eukprot:2686241-Amphidinium_carterae.2